MFKIHKVLPELRSGNEIEKMAKVASGNRRGYADRGGLILWCQPKKQSRRGATWGWYTGMLWNDCCGRDIDLALETMMCMPTPEIVRHINYEGGRGIPIEGMKP